MANTPFNNVGSLSRSREDASATVKLPRLEIGKLNGIIKGWCTFWDQYVATTHQNAQVSNIENFKYLKGYLVGKAQDTISGISLTDSNYHIAADLLQERFGEGTFRITIT